MKGHLRKRGDAWELRAYVGSDPTTNRQKYLTRTFRGGKREADAALARFVTEVAGGGHAAQDTTFGELIRQWLDLAKADLSPSTVRGYERVIKSYITPVLGHVALSRLKPADLDRFYANLRDHGGQDGSPLAAATVRQAHAICRRALQQGVRWGWIAANPAVLASPPRVRPPRLHPPDPNEVMRLIAEASAANPDFGSFLHLAAVTGARRGELCALRWCDVDFEDATLTISRSIVETASNALVEKDTKTHAARRIAIDGETVDLLQDLHDRASEGARSCDSELLPATFVFSPTVDGTKPWTPNDITRMFIRVRNKIGLSDVRLHDLRHFAATRLLGAGVPVRTVSGRLGHANAATTLGVYAHFLEVSDRDAASRLGAMISAKNA